MALEFRGIDISRPVNRLRAGWVALCVNARAYLRGTISLRNLLSSAIYTFSGGTVNSISRLNDTTPSGPTSGYAIISNVDDKIYVGNTKVVSGLSGNPVSMVPFRPNTSVQPWMYIADSSQSVTIESDPTNAVAGMIKVRSDGKTYKAGIKEPQNAPTVGINTTVVTQYLTLPANTPPWTNVGGVNASYNYSGTDTQPPYPATIDTPVANATVTLTVTGTATVNGATHAPGDSGPSSSTYPGAFITSPKIVVFAFTDADGNIIAQSTASGAPPVVGNVGASATITVPSGAAQLQIGIDSAGGTFSSNSGSYLVQATVSTSAIAQVSSISGTVNAYIWGDSPHSGSVACYLWKNPNDSGTGIARTIGTASATASNNSLILDSSPEDKTVPVLWTTLNSSGSAVGTINLFDPALESDGYADFNACIVGNFFIPKSGTYSVQLQYKDQIMFGVGGGATTNSGSVYGYAGQSISVVNALPLMFVSTPNGSGSYQTTTISVTFPAMGIYQFELDWDYWYHTGRSLIVKMSPTPGASVATIPPLPSGVRTDVIYYYKYRASSTGAQSNPSQGSPIQYTPVLANTVTSAFSDDPQVDKVDYYRQDSGLANPTYVATGPNDGTTISANGIVQNTPITDTLSDTAAASNDTMNSDDFEPVASIDTPKSGYVTIVDGVVTWKSGDKFNVRWLPGTIMLIGSPTQMAYSLVSRPMSDSTIVIPDVPDTIGDAAGSGVPYNIAEPILGNQPLAYVWGPTDQVNFACGCGDAYRPGTLYTSKGNNLDSWPDTNQQDITDPSEPLVNGAMSGGINVVFSISRAWILVPNYANTTATATGTVGSIWIPQLTAINRGLFIPRCLAVEGGGKIFFRVSDGIDVSVGGGTSVSITNETLYPLFSHEGSTPTSVTRNGVTLYPPDDTKPNAQKFKIVGQFLYYDFIGTDGNPHTWVFDINAMAWVWDSYSIGVTAHATNTGQSTQGTLVGCSDGTIRSLVSTGASETATATVVSGAMGGRGWMHCNSVTVEYSSEAAATMSLIAVDTNNGSYGAASVTLPSTGGVMQKAYITLGPNKWKLSQFKFTWADPTFQLYMDGFAANVKPWGDNGLYTPINPFAGVGGYGSEE